MSRSSRVPPRRHPLQRGGDIFVTRGSCVTALVVSLHSPYATYVPIASPWGRFACPCASYERSPAVCALSLATHAEERPREDTPRGSSASQKGGSHRNPISQHLGPEKIRSCCVITPAAVFCCGRPHKSNSSRRESSGR